MCDSKAESLLYVLKLHNDCTDTTIPLSKQLKSRCYKTLQ